MENFITIKQDAIKTQLSALNAVSGYRITLKPRLDGLPPCNFGNRMNAKQRKAAGKEERFYTSDELSGETIIRQLTAENMRGYDIYVTPMSPAVHYIVLDDVSPASMKALVSDGYAPALTQRSSYKNAQAIIIIGKQVGRDEQSVANVIVKRLNVKYGDALLTGVIHPFRLAGFFNKKEDKNDKPTVVLSAEYRVCVKADAELMALRSMGNHSAVSLSRGGGAPVVCDLVCTPDNPETIAFTRYFTQNLATAKERYDKPDYDKIDYQSARSMSAIGYTLDQITSALLSASPHISKRHKHVVRYAATTAANAASPRSSE